MVDLVDQSGWLHKPIYKYHWVCLTLGILDVFISLEQGEPTDSAEVFSSVQPRFHLANKLENIASTIDLPYSYEFLAFQTLSSQAWRLVFAFRGVPPNSSGFPGPN